MFKQQKVVKKKSSNILRTCMNKAKESLVQQRGADFLRRSSNTYKNMHF